MANPSTEAGVTPLPRASPCPYPCHPSSALVASLIQLLPVRLLQAPVEAVLRKSRQMSRRWVWRRERLHGQG